MIITIDGRSAQGKTTLASKVAQQLGIERLSSGDLYRLIASNYIAILDDGADSDSALTLALATLSLEHLKEAPESRLRSDEVARQVGALSRKTDVRRRINDLLADYCRGRNIVLDGRDMAEVFPFARFKFFLVSSLEERATLVAQNRDLSISDASILVQMRDDSEPVFQNAGASATVLHPLRDGFRHVESEMLGIVRAGSVAVRSRWDIQYVGAKNNDIGIVNVAAQGYRRTDSYVLTIFEGGFEYYSHPALLFLEQYVPYCYAESVQHLRDVCTSQFLEVTIRDGFGYLTDASPGSSDTNTFRYLDPPMHALCSHERGLQFLKQHQAETVSIRAEFFEQYKYDDHKRDLLLRFACTNFKRVLFRLYDSSTDSGPELASESGRGVDYMRSNFENFLVQIDLAQTYYESFENVQLLVPLLRNEQELDEVLELIGGRFRGMVAVMIEVPLMIYRFKQFSDRSHTFVIGVGDLSASLSASARNKINFTDQIDSLIADLIASYILPFATTEHTIFVASQSVLDLLRERHHECRLLHLAKF